MPKPSHVAMVFAAALLFACGESTPPPAAPVGGATQGKTTAHGSGGGTGAHGHPKRLPVELGLQGRDRLLVAGHHVGDVDHLASFD
mgnify:CR=1 FL=1